MTENVESPLPPYTYTPRRTPHPLSDPAGHSYGRHEPSAVALDPNGWDQNEPYARGLRLFNHGYYWEAHEAWEAVWHAAGRSGPISEFLKGLIKWAAAGVKAREGRSEGVRRHLDRAMELFHSASKQLPDPFAGQSTTHLIASIAAAKSSIHTLAPCQDGRPVIYWPAALNDQASQ
jgi:hypothetical protein